MGGKCGNELVAEGSFGKDQQYNRDQYNRQVNQAKDIRIDLMDEGEPTEVFFLFFFCSFFFSFIFISWRLITLQYCSGFCHTLT